MPRLAKTTQYNRDQHRDSELQQAQCPADAAPPQPDAGDGGGGGGGAGVSAAAVAAVVMDSPLHLSVR